MENQQSRKKATGKTMGLLTILEAGDSFYTDVKPKNVTHYAKTLGVKVTTESVLVVEGYLLDAPVSRKITKVTLL